MQVQVAAEGELVAVARGAVLVVAAVQVTAHFAGVVDFEVVTLFRQFAACAVPVTEHPRRLAIEGRGGMGAGGEAQGGEATEQAQGISAGNRC
ncbi:hypothetical protein D3C85_906810 [compost metagenome]